MNVADVHEWWELKRTDIADDDAIRWLFEEIKRLDSLCDDQARQIKHLKNPETAGGVLPDCMIPDGGDGPCLAYREMMRQVKGLAEVAGAWCEQLCAESSKVRVLSQRLDLLHEKAANPPNPS